MNIQENLVTYQHDVLQMEFANLLYYKLNPKQRLFEHSC